MHPETLFRICLVAGIWLFIASKGDPDLRTEVIEGEPSINIGGYGLFVQ